MCTQNLNLSSGTKGSSVAQSALSSRVDRNLVGRGLSRIDDKYFHTRKSVKVKIIDIINVHNKTGIYSLRKRGETLYDRNKWYRPALGQASPTSYHRIRQKTFIRYIILTVHRSKTMKTLNPRNVHTELRSSLFRKEVEENSSSTRCPLCPRRLT